GATQSSGPLPNWHSASCHGSRSPPTFGSRAAYPCAAPARAARAEALRGADHLSELVHRQALGVNGPLEILHGAVLALPEGLNALVYQADAVTPVIRVHRGE